MSRFRASTSSAATSVCRADWVRVMRAATGVGDKSIESSKRYFARASFRSRAGGLDERLVLGELALDEGREALGAHRHRLGVERGEAGLQLGRGEGVDEGRVQARRRLGGQAGRREQAEPGVDVEL